MMGSNPPSTFADPAAVLRALRQADRQPAVRLVLLLAPAGAGKSAALRRWAAARAGACAWLSLEPGDAAPERCQARILAALEPFAALPRECADGCDDAAAALIDALLGMPAGFALVLDQYHVIGDARVHALLGRVLEYLPAHVRVFVGARGAPPWPIARMRVRRQVVVIR